MLSMLLTEQHRLILEMANAITEKTIRPFTKMDKEEKLYPSESLKSLAQAGLMGMLIPEEWGGSQIDHLSYVLVLAEIAKANAALSTLVSVHNSVATLPLLHFGTELQKESFLRPLAKGQKLGAFCLSEPQAGSDISNLITKAQRHGDNYILNGVKQFVTNGQHADIAIIFAVTQSTSSLHEITAFIVPTHTPGYTVAKIENKMGQHQAELAQIVLDNVTIPVSYQLGNQGEGAKIALSSLECGRLGIAAQSLGIAEEALRLSIQYSLERKSFGKFLHQHQAIGFKLADMATQLEATKSLVYHAATLRDHHLPALKEISMAKLFASETAEKICREAIQIYGGYGYLKDFPLERLYRDVRATTIYEGTSDIQRMIIKRELIKSFA